MDQVATGYAGYFAGKVAATSYLTVSDRNVKTDFTPIDGPTVLERIDQMPIASWAFKDDRKLRHIGPTAQDFHAAFGLNGEDDKHINLADASGVSLAAIQELNKRLKEKDARIATLERQLKSLNDTVSARLAKLEEHASRRNLTVSSNGHSPRCSELTPHLLVVQHLCGLQPCGPQRLTRTDFHQCGCHGARDVVLGGTERAQRLVEDLRPEDNT